MRVSRPRSCAMASESARCADVTHAPLTETMAAATIAPTSATSFRRARSQIFDRGRAGAPALNRPPKLLVRWGETTWKYLGIDVLELAKRCLPPRCRGLRLTCGENGTAEASGARQNRLRTSEASRRMGRCERPRP